MILELLGGNGSESESKFRATAAGQRVSDPATRAAAPPVNDQPVSGYSGSLRQARVPGRRSATEAGLRL